MNAVFSTAVVVVVVVGCLDEEYKGLIVKVTVATR